MKATELRINSKNFPPPVAEAFNRLGLPDRIVIKDLRIVFQIHRGAGGDRVH